jgi:hypothetical protein
LENLKGRDHVGDLDIDGAVILKLILMKCDVRICTGFKLLRIATSSDLLKVY